MTPGEHVERGQVLAYVHDPYTGERIDTVQSPVTGVVFFSHKDPLVTQSTIIYRIIDDAVIS